MTPDELRSFAEEATPTPWEVTDFGDGKPKKYVKLHFGGGHSFTTLVHSYENARLIALAPDLARLCAEYAGAFAQIEKLHHKDFDLAPQIARRALAKLSELKPAP